MSAAAKPAGAFAAHARTPEAPTQALGVGQSAQRELIIKVYPDSRVQYEGAAAQLIAEGLIPAGFEWPLAAADRQWQANGFDYWLRRARPDGHKGPMRSWLEMDNWFVRVEVSGRDYWWMARRAIERKKQELQADIYRQTAEGRRAWNRQWQAYCRASDDKAFQAFKATFLPEPKKPGRKPKQPGPAEGGAQ